MILNPAHCSWVTTHGTVETVCWMGGLMSYESRRYRWVKSSRCDSANCVEVGRAGQSVYLRSSGSPNGTFLAFGERGWGRFIQEVKSGLINKE